MPNADILLDDDSIELRDGDVSITRTLSLYGNFTIFDSNNELSTRLTKNGDVSIKKTLQLGGALSILDANNNITIKISTNGNLEISSATSSAQLVINSAGITIYNNTGNPTVTIDKSGGILLMNSDLTMLGSSDVKLDGQFLATRLNAIEQRLTNGGL